jgi:hypothetical protein
MTETENKLERLAEAVADGEVVDWQQENLSDSRIANLSAIERLSDVLRGEGDPDVIAIGGGNTMPMDCTKPSLPCQWGHLEVRMLIGSGAYGEVYRSYDTRLQKDVALKILRPRPEQAGADFEAFLEEARKLARVDHANVVRVYGANEHRGCYGFWMELIDGRTLEEILEADGPFSHREAQRIGLELAHAIAASHAQGLLHRDIKTANVMREKGGRIVLMDFSAAIERLAIGGQDLAGTPLYMAPELFEGGDPTPQADVYSLGVLLYRLVTGRYPVDGRTRTELEGNHRHGNSTPLVEARPDLPQWFIDVVERAIHRDPARRYTSIGEMERALAESDTSLMEPVLPAPPVLVVPWWKRWQVLVPATTAVAALVVLVLTLIPSAGPFEVNAGLYRAGADSDERLHEGASVAPGDQLFLEVEATAPLYTYVVNEDEFGNAYLLYPLPELDSQNPLAAGATHRLPGPLQGEEVFWDVTSAGGTETILVVAAKEPQEELEALLASLGNSVDRGPIPLGGETTVRLRGLGGLSRPSTQAGQSTITGNVLVTASRSSDVWMWEMKLINP